jgi:glutamine amidotransferase
VTTADPIGPRIGVIDHGAGNLVSLDQALRHVGAFVVPVRTPESFDGLDGLVLPGVGAAAPAMARLRRRGLVGPIRAWAADGRPLLGVCLGLQLLFERSDEDGARTLALLPGRTVRLVDAPKLPHIGWNQVERRREHPILSGLADGSDFYFVHSYAAAPDPSGPDVVVAETRHGAAFPSVVASGSVVGVQFHPERSGKDGLRVLADFVALVTSAGHRHATAPRLDAFPAAAEIR